MAKDKILNFFQQISTGLKKLPRQTGKQGSSYCGTNKIHYSIKNQVKRDFIKRWYKKHEEKISFADFISLINLLYKSNIYEEVTLGSELIGLNRQFRKRINPLLIDQWLDNLNGWAEVDSLCQSKFGASIFLPNWKTWKKLIIKLASSSNLNKKRASIVLLVKPVREVYNLKLKTLAFEIINKHKHHKEILITKAVSWLLREMIKNYRKDVESFININISSLPKIAIRETRRKLKTGKK